MLGDHVTHDLFSCQFASAIGVWPSMQDMVGTNGGVVVARQCPLVETKG